MTKLKLVVNNSFSNSKKNEIFFNRQELKIILNLYAKMVSQGYWKDYSFNISKKRISFFAYKGVSGDAIFKISKNFHAKNNNLKYYISDTQGNILSMSDNLKILLSKVKFDNYRIVN